MGIIRVIRAPFAPDLLFMFAGDEKNARSVSLVLRKFILVFCLCFAAQDAEFFLHFLIFNVFLFVQPLLAICHVEQWSYVNLISHRRRVKPTRKQQNHLEKRNLVLKLNMEKVSSSPSAKNHSGALLCFRQRSRITFASFVFFLWKMKITQF